MHTLPLLTHAAADDVVAWHLGRAISRSRFLADVSGLARLLPEGGHMLNMCGDRYRFSVGLAAALVTGKVSLLPSTHTPAMIRQLRQFAPDVFCLTDDAHCTADLPRLHYAVEPADTTADHAVPRIPGSQCVAIVFTSGSTGTPRPHAKTWAALVSSVHAEADRLGLLDGAGHTLVGTVPPQHMYGLESTVLMAWLSGNALSDRQPFYPADVVQALAEVPAPRTLVTSPVHLRTLREARLALPALQLVVSATAPLAESLAGDLEADWQAPVLEIYGSTETGLIATRRPSAGPEWELLPGITLREQDRQMYADGGHIAEPTLMNDRIELRPNGRFLLHGRNADLINIAGKRHSLATLNHLLTSIPGVLDGAFYMPDASDADQVVRLAACVVAPGLDAAGLLRALRECVDPVFLPRPLLFLPALPRNSTGKLPHAALRALFESADVRESA